jgi:surfeit locus 1 family protein
VRRYAILLIGAVVALVCVRLGLWQISRLSQRRALQSLVVSRESMSPLEVMGRAGVPDSLGYRSARVRGRFDFDHQVIVVSRVVNEVPAVYVVTPLRWDDHAILVERGWVPSADAYSVGLDSLAESDTATVTGLLLPASQAGRAVVDSGWPLHVVRDDPAVLAARFPYALFPLVLRRAHTTGRGVPAALRAIPAPVIGNGPHLSYAIQWFSFALIAIVGSVVLYRKERREERQAESGQRQV